MKRPFITLWLTFEWDAVDQCSYATATPHYSALNMYVDDKWCDANWFISDQKCLLFSPPPPPPYRSLAYYPFLIVILLILKSLYAYYAPVDSNRGLCICNSDDCLFNLYKAIPFVSAISVQFIQQGNGSVNALIGTSSIWPAFSCQLLRYS